MEIVWTKQALSKLNKFVDYIAQDDIVTAELWATKLIEKTDQLIEQPESGRIVPEHDEPNLRELIVGNYRVIYRIRREEKKIYIQTVWHVRQVPPKSDAWQHLLAFSRKPYRFLTVFLIQSKTISRTYLPGLLTYNQSPRQPFQLLKWVELRDLGEQCMLSGRGKMMLLPQMEVEIRDLCDNTDAQACQRREYLLL